MPKSTNALTFSMHTDLRIHITNIFWRCYIIKLIYYYYYLHTYEFEMFTIKKKEKVCLFKFINFFVSSSAVLKCAESKNLKTLNLIQKF